MKSLLIIIGSSLLSMHCFAQKTYTEKLRQNEAGKGTVIINHSPEIDEVVNAKTSEHNTKKATPVKKDDTHTGSAATKVTPKNTGHMDLHLREYSRPS